MVSRMQFKGWPILLTIVLVLILQLVSPAQIWTMLFIGFGLMLLVAYFWAKSLKNGFLLTRERRYGMAQVGDRVEERFTIQKTGMLPALWVEIIDHSNLPEYSASQVRGLGTTMQTRWQTEMICTRRGVYQLGPLDVSLGDPFGLFKVEQHYPNMVDFTVTPSILPLPNIEVTSRGHVGEGAPRPYNLAPTEPASTVRAYTPADSLNRVHWPTTARRESLYVKGLQEPTSGDWWLALDLDQSAHTGVDQTSTLETGVLIAASLVDQGLRDNQAVGLLAHSQGAVWLPPKSSPLQRWQLLTTLARVQAGSLNLGHLLTRSHALIKQNTSLIVITPSLDSQWLDPLLMFKRQGVAPTIFLIYTDETRAGMQGLQQALILESVRSYLIEQASLTPPTAEELAGRWEDRVLATGRVVVTHRPKGEWETL